MAYPRGSMHLRETTRWTSIIASSKESINHKTKSIERILNVYPKHKFIFVGVSVENDPMIYAGFMRRYPKQISVIIIRDVTPNKDISHYKKFFLGLIQIYGL